MVAKAGGEDVLGKVGKPSYKVTPEQIAQSGAEIIIVMPCGYNPKRAASEWRGFRVPESWSDLPAIREGSIHAVDANAFFSRPGPRLADGVALLAQILHPAIFKADSLSQTSACKLRSTVAAAGSPTPL
jgi:iron complex transport system substrate-binding protein